MQIIPNSELNAEMIPLPMSSYADISEFSITFYGYDLPNCAELANSRTAVTLSELRAVLFFEQRRFRHFGHNPAGNDLEYIRSIVCKIRERVESGEIK
jgi:hypothetical protein